MVEACYDEDPHPHAHIYTYTSTRTHPCTLDTTYTPVITNTATAHTCPPLLSGTLFLAPVRFTYKHIVAPRVPSQLLCKRVPRLHPARSSVTHTDTHTFQMEAQSIALDMVVARGGRQPLVQPYQLSRVLLEEERFE